MIPLRLRHPVDENREAPANADDTLRRRIINGTADAVAAIARIEARAADHSQSKRRGSRIQAAGDGSNPAPAVGGGGRPDEFTAKLV